MEAIFLKVLNLSITASWAVLAVIIIRLLLKKAPKWISCMLWLIVALRLALPFSIESVFSLIPSAEVIPQNIGLAKDPAINSGIGVIDQIVNPIISSSLAPDLTYSANPIQILTFIAAMVWVIGIALMLIYALISYISLSVKTAPRILYKENVYYCDNIYSPFILGIIKPKIYLPSGINEEDIDYVIAHEKAHLKRLDHIIKPVGFLLLAVYWFNPFIWVAYILLCRDIEAACDQRVIKEMDSANKKGYLEALVACSTHRRNIMACPLAFGEVGVKGRIKSALNYKKPAFWVIIISVITCVAVAVGFLTNPKNENKDVKINGSNLDGVSVSVVSFDSEHIEIKWKNDTEKEIIFGEEFYILKQTNGKWTDCRKTKEYAWNLIAHMLKPFSETAHKYNITNIDTSLDGNYRFESNCFIDGDSSNKYKVWAEFEINRDNIVNDSSLQNQNPYFNATVLEVSDKNALVEPFSDADIRKTADKVYINTDVISTNPVPKLKKGMNIRVVYNGVIAETYPASISGVFAIYELDKNGEVIFESGDEVKYIFNPVEISYDNGMYSYVADVEGLPTYEIINDFELYEMHFNGPQNLHGKMTEIKLSKEKFDSRFSTYKWDKTESIRKNNKTAWEVYSPFKAGELPRLYLLLEQKDGTFYLAEGYYNMNSDNPSNSDDSLIRWVYKLEEVESLLQANPKW